MTDKDELNKGWAELEGWEFKECVEHRVAFSARYPMKDGNGKGRNSLPTFAEPNHFFGEVVPRMKELGFEYSIELCGFHKKHQEIKPYRIFRWHHHETDEEMMQVYDKDVGWGGLSSAIEARKEIGR